MISAGSGVIGSKFNKPQPLCAQITASPTGNTGKTKRNTITSIICIPRLLNQRLNLDFSRPLRGANLFAQRHNKKYYGKES